MVDVKQKVEAGETGNSILDYLPSAAREVLSDKMDYATYRMEDLVFEAGKTIDQVCFVVDGIISLTAETGDNGLVEVGMTGSEGFVGVPSVLTPRAYSSHRAMCQVGGASLRISGDDLHFAMSQSPELRELCMRYVQFFLVQTSQSAACNARHDSAERLARWLLMTNDRLQGDELPMTQRFLSYMIGVSRPNISIATSALENEGLIQQKRGKIIILDRARLEARACKCYGLIQKSRRNILDGIGG